MSEESMEYDVVIVGAGPAGLSAAIRLKQLDEKLRICVLEKGSEVGAHILSGAAMDPRAISELIPDWLERGAPIESKVSKDRFLFLTRRRAIPLPVPPSLRNHKNYVVSLANLCRWMAGQAERLGVEIFAGFPAETALIEDGQVVGIKTGEFGRGRDGSEKPGYQPGIEIRATHTLFAEGCRGHISEQLMQAFQLRSNASPQSYGIGIKEVWEVVPEKHRAGEVVHTVGWPLKSDCYGGSFVYHMSNNQVAIGYIVGLDYRNPYLDPYLEFQCFKTHPAIRPLLEGGRRIAYGARALNEGGLQAIPQLAFPGGALIGCAAGFLNVARIKGSHSAIASGMLAAEAIAKGTLESYPERFEKSWLHKELHEARNVRPAFQKFGLYGGMAYAALEGFILRGKTPWTLTVNNSDHARLQKAAQVNKISYPAPDGEITFDRMSSVYLSNTNHEEDQPCHLQLKDPALPVAVNLVDYAGPEARYCPAGVYEYVQEGGENVFRINAQNCVHCKTCDIKDPIQNIHWTVPEGGGGPNYGNM